MAKIATLSRLLGQQDKQSIYNTIEFHRMIDAHVPYYKARYKNRRVEITALERMRYSSRLNAYLAHKSVPYSHYYLIMRLNDLTNPNQFLPTTEEDPNFVGSIQWYDNAEFENLLSQWRTTQAKK